MVFIVTQNFFWIQIETDPVEIPKIKEEHLPENENEEDDEFYQAFISALKEKNLQEKNQESSDPNKMEVEENPKNQRDFLSEDEDVIEYVKNDPDEVGDDYFTKQRKLAEKKDLKAIDHTKMQYEPFRKNFYIESKEMSSLTAEEKANLVVKLRKELGDIKVRGKVCPAPITNWYQCGLSDKILRILIEKRKYGKPFPIQCQVLIFFFLQLYF